MSTFLLLNGPNLSLLGQREPELYGRTTLDGIETQITDLAAERGHSVTCFQSDAAHELVKRIHAANDEHVDLILFNPAAFTHTSVVLRDALLAVGIPFIEVHLSNVAAREDFRQRSYFADIAIGTITGFGMTSYELALTAAERYLAK